MKDPTQSIKRVMDPECNFIVGVFIISMYTISCIHADGCC